MNPPVNPDPARANLLLPAERDPDHSRWPGNTVGTLGVHSDVILPQPHLAQHAVPQHKAVGQLAAGTDLGAYGIPSPMSATSSPPQPVDWNPVSFARDRPAPPQHHAVAAQPSFYGPRLSQHVHPQQPRNLPPSFAPRQASYGISAGTNGGLNLQMAPSTKGVQVQRVAYPQARSYPHLQHARQQPHFTYNNQHQQHHQQYQQQRQHQQQHQQQKDITKPLTLDEINAIILQIPAGGPPASQTLPSSAAHSTALTTASPTASSTASSSSVFEFTKAIPSGLYDPSWNSPLPSTSIPPQLLPSFPALYLPIDPLAAHLLPPVGHPQATRGWIGMENGPLAVAMPTTVYNGPRTRAMDAQAWGVGRKRAVGQDEEEDDDDDDDDDDDSDGEPAPAPTTAAVAGRKAANGAGAPAAIKGKKMEKEVRCFCRRCGVQLCTFHLTGCEQDFAKPFATDV
ncbi:hypothetical protein HK101_000777, partial [Irineochytrium annulatum]